MRLLAAVIALFVTGCDSGTFTRRAGQDEAERIVWHELYSMPGDAPPVEWIHHVITGDHSGFTIIGSRVQVSCAEKDSDPDEYPISATSYAHELMHYKTWLETGDVDPLHWRGDWNLADNIAGAELSRAGL